MVVAGAGPAGLATAIGLARAGWDTVVVGAPRRVPPPPAESLPSAARPWVERLGVLADLGALPHRRVLANDSTWGSDRPWETPAMLSPYGAGWHVDRGSLEAALRREAAAAGAHLVDGTVAHLEGDAGSREVVLAGPAPRRYAARSVVDATGRAAAVARRLGARVHVAARLVAAATTGTKPPAGVADQLNMVEAVRDGWWYSAPLGAGHAVLFFTLPPILRSYRSLAEALREAPRTRARVGALRETARVVAAHATQTRPCAGPGWVAVGDAAHTLDPLASGGLLEALRGGLRAAEAVAAALGGVPATTGRYAEMQEAAFRHHLRQRALFYRAERRWPEAPFWVEAAAEPPVPVD